MAAATTHHDTQGPARPRQRAERRGLPAALAVLAPLAVALMLTGCATSSEHMREVGAARALGTPPGNTAQVVFIRPSGTAGFVSATIVDERGTFLGDTIPESYFVVMMPPGEHVFVAWADTTAAVQAQLAAGKTYYLQVVPKIGLLADQVDLVAVTPGSEQWGELEGWLAESRELVPDQAAGQAALDQRRSEVHDAILRGREHLGSYVGEELAAHTLRPEQGQ